jgi:hypothetical protein
MNCFGCVYSLNEWGLCGRGLSTNNEVCPYHTTGYARTPAFYDRQFITQSGKPYPKAFDLGIRGMTVFNSSLSVYSEAGVNIIGGQIIYEIIHPISMDSMLERLRSRLPRRAKIRDFRLINDVNICGRRLVRIYTYISYRRHNPRQRPKARKPLTQRRFNSLGELLNTCAVYNQGIWSGLRIYIGGEPLIYYEGRLISSSKHIYHTDSLPRYEIDEPPYNLQGEL